MKVWTHWRTHGRRLESHTISLPWAFGSDVLKKSKIWVLYKTEFIFKDFSRKPPIFKHLSSLCKLFNLSLKPIIPWLVVSSSFQQHNLLLDLIRLWGYKIWVNSQAQNKAQWLAACGHVSTTSQSLRFILSLRLYSSFITSGPGL